MDNHIPMTGYFDLSSLKGNGEIYQAEINKIRNLYAVFIAKESSIRCCDRGVYPKTALSHMGFRFIAMEEVISTEYEVDSDCVIREEGKLAAENDIVAEKEVISLEEEVVDKADLSIETEIQGVAVDKKLVEAVEIPEISVLDCVVNKHNIYMISVGKGKIFYSLARAGEDKNDDAYLSPLLFPGIKIIELNIGVKYKELMNETERINMGYSYSVIKDAVELLSGGYKVEKKQEWGRAIVILLTITCEAVRSNAICEFVKKVLNDNTDTLHKMPPQAFKELNLWGKISDVAYGKRKAVRYDWIDDQNFSHTGTVKNISEVETIFAVLKAPPDDHIQAKYQKEIGALTSHLAFRTAHQNLSNTHPSFGMPRSYSTLLTKTVAGTQNFWDKLSLHGVERAATERENRGLVLHSGIAHQTSSNIHLNFGMRSKASKVSSSTLLPNTVTRNPTVCDKLPMNGSIRAASGGLMFKAIATTIRLLRRL